MVISDSDGKVNCSGLPDRTTLRRVVPAAAVGDVTELFRSSRPDYIETRQGRAGAQQLVLVLFRSSRPDYIETAPRGAIRAPSLG